MKLEKARELLAAAAERIEAKGGKFNAEERHAERVVKNARKTAARARGLARVETVAKIEVEVLTAQLLAGEYSARRGVRNDAEAAKTLSGYLEEFRDGESEQDKFTALARVAAVALERLNERAREHECFLEQTDTSGTLYCEGCGRIEE